MGFKSSNICILFLLIQIQAISPSNNCRILKGSSELKCNGSYPKKSAGSSNITEIYLTNVTWEYLEIDDILNKFPNVERIFVEYSDITTIIVPTISNKIKELSLRYNQLKKLPQDFVKNFPNLEILNIQNNLLTNLEDNFYMGKLQKLTIKNNPWICALDLSWALHLNQTIVHDLKNATCKERFAGKNILLIANYKQEMYRNCTKSCACSLENVVQDLHTDQQHPIIMVNCSGRGLKDLPTQLPLYTRILHLERNEITDLRPLKSNPMFESLWDLYLDNNTVTSISYLEGSHWLQNFRVFSLRGNQLQKVPSFALDNALMKNPNMPGAVVLYLGNNPWRCDCIFVPTFQEYVLQKYSNRIADISDVKCKYVEGDENSWSAIINLSRSSVCMVPSDFSLQEGLDLLNAVLASLIIFILGKLAYDYYHFKKSGRLPWIVTKIP